MSKRKMSRAGRAASPDVGRSACKAAAPGHPQAARRSAMLLSLAALGVRLMIIVHSGAMTDQGLYIDDAYISHKIAWNIAEGRGITQAGQPTNGFQPLFVFLLVPLYLVLDPAQATVASAVMSAAFGAAGAWYVFRILERLFGGRVGVIGAALWATSGFLSRVSLNGLETSLANLLMLVLVFLHVRFGEGAESLSTGRAVVFGGLAGLAILARVDLAILVVLILMDQLRIREPRRSPRVLATAIVVGAGVMAPWFLRSTIVCGRLMPISGPATRTIAQLYGSPSGPVADPAYFELGHPPASFYAAHVRGAFVQILTETPLSHPMYVGMKRPVAGSVILLASWGVLAWLAHRAPRGNAGARESASLAPGRLRALYTATRPAWGFAVLLVAAYALWCFGQWWMWRYMTPVSILMILPSALWVDAVMAWLVTRGRVPGRVVAALICGVYGWASVTGHARLFGPPPAVINEPRMYRDALDLRMRLEPDARVGSFESGILDYFLGRDVYNLDGKTNAAAHQALVEGRMDELVEQLRLDYVVSSPFLLRDLLVRRGRWPSGKLRFVDQLRHNVILRVERDPPPSPVSPPEN